MFPTQTRILIVDDMSSLRDLVKAYLRRLGYHTLVEASDGQEAFKVLLEYRSYGTNIDLVISDWNMPNQTGLELLKVVRSSNEFKNLPFILVTTENEKEKVIEAVQAGVSNYMVKPVEEKVLEEKLLRVWQKNVAKSA